MKRKGMVLMALGILGIIFVLLFDIILGKPRYYIGPKSITGLIISAIFILTGIYASLKKSKK